MGAINYLELDSNTNISVATATEIGSYTATDYRLVFARLYAQDLAGSGDYIYYATLTPSGLSEAIIGTKTTQTLAAGETKLAGMSVPMILNAGDVFKVYLDGLAGDTTNVDTRVWFYDANDPATAVLDAVAADYDDANSIGAKINDIATVAQIQSGLSTFDPLTDNVTLADNGITAAKLADDAISEIQSGLSTFDPTTDTVANVTTVGTVTNPVTTTGSGTGAITYIYNITDSSTGLPLPDVLVNVSTDISGVNLVATGTTDSFGNITFYLDAGDYYFWSYKDGYSFVNPDLEEVS